MINNKTITNISEEVAPFAKRLINPEYFGSTKILNKIGQTRKTLDLIKDQTTKNQFYSLYERIISERSNIENLSDKIVELSQKVELINNPETKELILNEIKKISKLSKKDYKNNFSHKMIFIENATDAINIMNNKYLNIKSEPREFYEWLNKKNSWFADVIDGEIKPQNTYRNGYAQCKNEKMDYDKYLENFSKAQKMKIPETFQNDLNLEAFRKLVENYIFFEPELIKKIYLNEYLNIQPKEIQEILKRINKTYGTLVISSNANLKLNDAKYIEEELKIWKETGKDKAILPEIINIDYLDKYLNLTNAEGAAYNFEKRITIRDLLNKDANTIYSSSTIRHEINHLNDRNLRPKNDFENLFEFIHWNINKILHKNKWKHELKNAGINEFYQNYALKNKHELKSVTSESNLKKLSDKFKKQLIKKFNMEEWIFNLKDNEILVNEKINKLINKKS